MRLYKSFARKNIIAHQDFKNFIGFGRVFQPADAFGTFGDLATTILTILTSAAGVIAVFFIIAAGIKFVTASGDEKKLASAASMITYAIIGLVVTALAFVILQIVQYFFGANVGTI